MNPLKHSSQISLYIIKSVMFCRYLIAILLCTDAGGLFEGDLFGEVTGSGSGAAAAAGMPGTSAQPQSLQVTYTILNLII